MNDYHTPVLLNELVTSLIILPGKYYVDATLGGGGHAQKVIAAGGKVIGIDQDDESIDYCNKLNLTNLEVVKGNFKDIKKILKSLQIKDIHGIYYDLGMSSHQLENSGKGFSLQRHELLDMRMSNNLTLTAADLINTLDELSLARLFKDYSDELNSVLFARATIKERIIKPIKYSDDYANLIARVSRGGPQRIHPATRIFQALRVAVNDEVNCFKVSLESVWDLLDNNGRICVITFNSLEERTLKESMSLLGAIKVGSIIRPTFSERTTNPRSRSAKLYTYAKTSSPN